jgi:hypothetical protein
MNIVQIDLHDLMQKVALGKEFLVRRTTLDEYRDFVVRCDSGSRQGYLYR